MNLPEGWKLVPVEPTEEMMEAALVYDSYFGDKKSELMEGIATDYRLMLAAAPTPPAQENEPTAWLIPRIVQYPSCTDTVVSWGASVFYDSQDKARVDSKGNVYYPKPLYIRPQSDELRKAAKELLAIADGKGRTDMYGRTIEKLRVALRENYGIPSETQ